MTDEQKIETIRKRRTFFDLSFPPLERCDARQDISFRLPNTCPSCGYLTLEARCSWDICSFCFWEDDGQDDLDADKICGGPNDDYSLTAHRLKTFEWFNNLRSNTPTDTSLEKDIGIRLRELDLAIESGQLDRSNILNKIQQLRRLFDLYRDIHSDNELHWNFVVEKEINRLKPAYNSGQLRQPDRGSIP